MAESWDEYKKKKREELGLEQIHIQKPVPRPQRKPELPADIPLSNIHKRSLPVGIDTIAVFNETREWAEWWVEHKLKTKCYENADDESKTLIYYDIIPVNATPKERSIYYNMRPLTTESIPGFDSPKRVN